MDILSAAERISAIDRSEVVFDPARCLHTRDKFSTCEACLDICPLEAIQTGKPPRLETEACASCLTCLPLCPTGAFSADDAVPDLLNCAAHVESRSLELICQTHPRAEKGRKAETVGIRLRGCLAGLGNGTYLALAAVGIEHITVRLDACAECPWASLQGQVEKQAQEAKLLLDAWGKAEMVGIVTALEEPVERPLWEAKNPPLSRRDLFVMLSRQGQVALARAIEKEVASAERKAGRGRLRLNHAIAHLPTPQNGGVLLGELGFSALAVNEACTACGTCARICPTQALTFEVDEDAHRYTLRFSAKLCIACEACAHACAEQAISLEYAPTAEQVWGPQEAVLLRDGELTRCGRCNAWFTARPDGVHLCPACEFRQKNPFGSRLPPGVTLPGRSLS